MYGTESNNAQLNEINKTHAGPEFEEVDIPVKSPIEWTASYTSSDILSGDVYFGFSNSEGLVSPTS